MIEELCHCGKMCEVQFSDRCAGGELTWYMSILCRSCGRVEEVDGAGSLPGDLRNILLQREGEWDLVVKKVGEDRALLLKQLRAVFGLTIPDAADLARSIPGLLRRGTYAEMACLKEGLEPNGRDWSLEIVRR